ncbi:hypothetical protein ES705_46718 [subsurface metagenome]
MMIWILKKFVKDGDIVLDPMAGIGGTLVEGMRLFPNSLFVGIELEEKFVKWCNASIKKVKKMAEEDWFMKVGIATCLQGDSRELGKIMGVDKIVSSPPYAERYAYRNPRKNKKTILMPVNETEFISLILKILIILEILTMEKQIKLSPVPHGEAKSSIKQIISVNRKGKVDSSIPIIQKI